MQAARQNYKLIDFNLFDI